MTNYYNKGLVLLVFLVTIGCDKEESFPAEVMNASRAGIISSETLALDEITGDVQRGKKLFIQCRACHSLKEHEPHKVGPNLYAFINRKAATKDDFIYSEALISSDIIWSVENIDLWLEKPYEIVPGNKMVFSGMSKSLDRRDLIAYLINETEQ